MKKRCGECKTQKDFNHFSKCKAKKDGHQTKCKECHSKYLKKDYQKNKARYISQAAESKRRLRQWYKNLKDNKFCHDCQKKFRYYVLDFDHKRTKEFNISEATRRGYSRKKILKEIEKCDLVCANCHRERTHKRFMPLLVD